MHALITLFVDLCLLRAKPQDLPSSKFLMLLCIGCYLLLGFALSIQEQGFSMAALTAMTDTGLLVGLIYLGLSIKNSLPRSLQTITALTGTGALFEFVSWPLVSFLQTLGESEGSSLWMILLALVLWNVTVIGNILRHAIEVPLWVGISIALLYIYISLQVMAVLFALGGVA